MTELGQSVSLTSGELHLHYAFPAENREEDLLAMLSAEERARRERFAFESDRRLYLVAHALVRSTLSRYRDIEPAAWTFSTGDQGKPYLADQPDLHFNLSHTEGIVICGVAREPVGVDVEDLSRSADYLALSQRFFSAAERDDLASHQHSEIAHAFFHYWTLKESYIKACGGGLSIPLDSFAFTPPASDPPRISFMGRHDHPSHWQFHRDTIGTFRIAAALQSERALRVQTRQTML